MARSACDASCLHHVIYFPDICWRDVTNYFIIRERDRKRDRKYASNFVFQNLHHFTTSRLNNDNYIN